MVKLPKYPLVYMNNEFNEEQERRLMDASIVLDEAVFQKHRWLELITQTNGFIETLTLIPDYPKKEWDLERYHLSLSIYKNKISGTYRGMNSVEALELFTQLIKPKTLYLGGDVDFYVWKTKSDVHLYNVSSTEIQHIVYYKSKFCGDVRFYVPQ